MSCSYPDQAFQLFFLSAYCGSGLLIQSLARCQPTPSRFSAWRTVSMQIGPSHTPRSWQTSAANPSVQVLCDFPRVRGLWCSSARNASDFSPSRMVRSFWGREVLPADLRALQPRSREWHCAPSGSHSLSAWQSRLDWYPQHLPTALGSAAA